MCFIFKVVLIEIVLKLSSDSDLGESWNVDPITYFAGHVKTVSLVPACINKFTLHITV